VVLLARVTTSPDGPAGPLRVTVPVEEVPSRTTVGLSATEATVAGLIVSVADWGEVPVVAVITADVTVETAVVDTAKLAVVDPAATVTVVGTVAAELPLDRVTIVPPAAAGPLNVTVPVEEAPPDTDVGFNVTEATVTGLIVKVAVNDTVPDVAVMVAATGAETPTVFTVNVPDVWPAATVTEAGTVAALMLLDKLTTNPPVGA